MSTILHLIDSLSVGGTEVLLKNTLPLLKIEKNIICYLNQPDELKPAFKDYPVYCLQHRKKTDILRTIRRLRKILKQHRVDIVHTHLFWSTLIARFAVPKTLPLVSTIHSVYSIDAFQKNEKALLAERLSVRKRHNIIAVSKFVLKDYLEWVRFKGRAFVLYDFLPGGYFTKSSRRKEDQQSLRCVAVGNFKEAKNYSYLLKIFSHLKNENVSLDIYGQGDLEKELNGIIQKEDLSVYLRGQEKITGDLLREYDLFVQASSHEGFGLSVIEAVATGLPVFISDIPVFREVTGGCAHFFSLTNPTQAAEQLIQVKQRPDLRYKYVDAAYSFARNNFSEQHFVTGLREIYAQVLRNKKGYQDTNDQFSFINDSTENIKTEKRPG